MVLTLDGNTEIGVHVWSEIGEIVNTNVCNVLPSNISAMLTQGGGLYYILHINIHIGFTEVYIIICIES